jgi:hypothetical protein
MEALFQAHVELPLHLLQPPSMEPAQLQQKSGHGKNKRNPLPGLNQRIQRA